LGIGIKGKIACMVKTQVTIAVLRAIEHAKKR
jgi:hypothetical protein